MAHNNNKFNFPTKYNAFVIIKDYKLLYLLMHKFVIRNINMQIFDKISRCGHSANKWKNFNTSATKGKNCSTSDEPSDHCADQHEKEH